MYQKVKFRVHTLLHPELGNTQWDRALNAFIILLILLNVLAVMLETVPSIYEPNSTFFNYFDLLSVIIFSIEYILRVWSCVHDKRYSHPVYGRLKYMVSPGAIIDLLAILPFYLHVFLQFDLRMLRILRLFRFLRLFRLTAYMKAAKMIMNVFKATFNQLMLGLVLVIILIIISSSIIYFIEHLVQPDVFTTIPDTIWWSVTTFTTVGYGDMVPVTTIGKMFTSVVLIAGVALFALPAGIITAGFLEETRRQKRSGKKQICPHCHKTIDFEEHANHA